MTDLVRYYIKTSIAFLFLGLALGAYMIFLREVRGFYPDTLLVTAHAHMILIGFVMMMIMGVALWMFPKPRRDDMRYRPDVAAVIYWVMVLSVSARFVGEVLKSTLVSPWIDGAIVLSAFLQVIGIAAFFLNIWPRIRGIKSLRSTQRDGSAGSTEQERGKETRPTESLMEDHRIIERMIRVLDTVAERLNRHEEVPPDVVRRIIDFIRTFADRCHHGKEEDLLYPLAEERGIPRDGGPIGAMLDEHDAGRSYTRGMADALPRYAAGDDGGRAMLHQNAWEYSNLLSQHILKEDNILYPMIDNVLTEEDQADMTAKFEAVELERMGGTRRREYIEMVEALEAEYVAPTPDAR